MKTDNNNTFKTDQESFWAGQFGDEYIARNESTPENVSGNLFFFSRIFEKFRPLPQSVIEFGSNIGINLKAIRLLVPNSHIAAVEINPSAVERLRKDKVADDVFHQSILEFETPQKFEFSLIKGVMIHLSPEHLVDVYKKLAMSSSRHVLIAEYYNRHPEEVLYRGHTGKLFRRDFGGEFMDANPEFWLVDYGFSYHRDSRELQDDLTWFLFERKA
jgi:spore coat polysaccharide biosynthesis protein SpsF